jgi:hypothetical protein
MFHFAPGVTIDLGGSGSCSAFCAYHNTVSRSSKSVMYGVHPFMGTGSGCEKGCGSSTLVNNSTAVTSHELIEAVTDPEIGLVAGSGIGRPAAWYDETNGEIGDICNGEQGSLPGTSYVVQTEWSNKAGKCIVTSGGTSCTPSCGSKICGDDGCGGSCGTCASGKSCTSAGQCVAACTPSCSGKSCGSDGCGGTCGTCASGKSCNSGGQCVAPSSSCAHDKCTAGKKLTATCDPCVQQICTADSYCCGTKWDASCVQEVADICGLTC